MKKSIKRGYNGGVDFHTRSSDSILLRQHFSGLIITMYSHVQVGKLANWQRVQQKAHFIQLVVKYVL